MHRPLLHILSFLILTFSTSLVSWSQTQQQKGIQMKASDYINFYQQVNDNISHYNQINDSLFGIYDKEQWVETYLRRARITSQIGQETQAIINYYKPFFKKDTLTASFLEALADTAIGIIPIIKDDFLSEELTEYLLQKEQRLIDSGTKLDHDYIATATNLAVYKYNTGASADPQSRQECVRILKDILDHHKPGRDIELTPATASVYIRASLNMSRLTTLVFQKMLSVEEIDHYANELDQILNDSVFCRGVDSKLLKQASTTLTNQPSSLLRNVFIPDTTHRYDDIRDKLSASFVNYYEQHPEKVALLTPSNMRRLVLMRHLMGKITTLQALEACNSLADTISQELKTEAQLKDKFNCILECIYYIDVSDLSYEVKREKVKAYCDEMLNDLAGFHYVNKMPQLVTALSSIASYPRIHKYLLTDERKEFLKQVLFFSQPFTRAHSETVTHLAMTILQSVLKHQPELLIGVQGLQSKKEVKKHKEQLLTLFHDGALFHDLGKTQMPDIIRNEYRQLNDHEFSIIRRHSELGMDYLKVDSSLLQLQDFILGHHKWYNGKGGYPASFDNTQSPYRTLIDILTLSDCLEAATARLGRNYRKNKHYGDVIKEFQAEAGTRYNPYLVQHILDHPKLGKQLEEICEKGWEDIYYKIFISHSAR